MVRCGRRGFLVLIAFLMQPGRLFAQPRPMVTLDQFIELSERLLGRTKLDRELAQVYLTALVADADTAVYLATLADSSGNPTPEQSAVARTIIEWWYTGVYTVGNQQQVATHAGALMWSALDRPAPGTCHGPFGAWSRPPATQV